jgi:hypothetical protein
MGLYIDGYAMKKLWARLLLITALVVTGCATVPPPERDAVVPEMDRLHEWLTGQFESRPGAKGSPRRMLARSIREDAGDHWIYVVQWRVDDGQPERQFVYRLVNPEEGIIALDIYSVLRPPEHPTEPTSASLAAIGPDDLQRRKGCRIQLSTDGLSYAGGTRGGDCPAHYRGASRMSIELTVRENEVREWLQGYDAEGDRLWTAEDFGRVYRRTGGP